MTDAEHALLKSLYLVLLLGETDLEVRKQIKDKMFAVDQEYWISYAKRECPF